MFELGIPSPSAIIPLAMLKPSIERMVYHYLFPHPKSSDPSDLHDFVRKYIISEVRSEVMRFYGNVSCLESQYPGLDYASRGHRLRLSQFKYHRRLFAAFDELRLTRSEIHSLCHWEGTKWAKEKYERDHSVIIRDTTWDDVRDYEPRKPPVVTPGVYFESQGGQLVKRPGGYGSEYSLGGMGAGGQTDEESEQESNDSFVARSVSSTINRHFPASAAGWGSARVSSDPAWEQWLKDATERGSIPSIAELGSSRRLAAFQAHIPAHYAFATPVNYYGPYSPAPATFSPTAMTSYYPTPMPQPLQPSHHYSTNSYSARSSRGHHSRTFR